jgi:single-strand DNA-binding protein
MASLNRIFLIGRLTRDPELRYLPNGTPKAELRLATSRQYKDKNGDKQEDTCYVDVVVWSRQAEIANQYLQKGRQVFVEGRLDYQEWEGQDGQKRSKHQVVADRVQFLDGQRGGVEGEDLGGAERGGGYGGPGAQRRERAYGQGAAPRGGYQTNGGYVKPGAAVAGAAQTYGARPANESAGAPSPATPGAAVATGERSLPVETSAPPPSEHDEPARPHGGPGPVAEAMGLSEDDLPF